MERWIFDGEYDVGMILEYCETLLPDQPLHQMSEQKMGTLVKVSSGQKIQDWQTLTTSSS